MGNPNPHTNSDGDAALVGDKLDVEDIERLAAYRALLAGYRRVYMDYTANRQPTARDEAYVMALAEVASKADP